MTSTEFLAQVRERGLTTEPQVRELLGMGRTVWATQGRSWEDALAKIDAAMAALGQEPQYASEGEGEDDAPNEVIL